MDIDETMKMAAGRVMRDWIGDKDLHPDYIIPGLLTSRWEAGLI